jgi:hypothetical protein
MLWLGRTHTTLLLRSDESLRSLDFSTLFSPALKMTWYSIVGAGIDMFNDPVWRRGRRNVVDSRQGEAVLRGRRLGMG